MTEVHGFGDGRNGSGGHQHQIEAQFLRLAQGHRGGHHLGGSVRENRAHLAHTNGLIDVLSAILPARRKVSGWIHLWLCVDSWPAKVNTKGPDARIDSLAENRNGVAKRQAQVVSVSVRSEEH